MAMDGCPWLRTGPPACEGTYADGLGAAYTRTLIVYGIGTALVCAYVLYRTAEVAVNGQFKGKAARKRIFFCSAIVAISLVIRAIDPFAWRRVLPPTVVWLCYDIATSAIYSILLFIVRNWLFVSVFFSKSAGNIWVVKRLFWALHVFVWVNFVVISVLQTNVSPQWLWHALKLLFGAAALLCIICVQTYFGVSMYRTLHEQNRQHGTSESPSRASHTSSPGVKGGKGIAHAAIRIQLNDDDDNDHHDDIDNDDAKKSQESAAAEPPERLRLPVGVRPTHRRARSVSRERASTLVERRRSSIRGPRNMRLERQRDRQRQERAHGRARSIIVPPARTLTTRSASAAAENYTKTRRGGAADDVARRVLRLMSWTTLAEVVSFLFQVMFALGALQNKYTRDDPAPPPDSNMDIVFEIVFDCIQGFGAVVAVHFFGLKPHERKRQLVSCVWAEEVAACLAKWWTDVRADGEQSDGEEAVGGVDEEEGPAGRTRTSSQNTPVVRRGPSETEMGDI